MILIGEKLNSSIPKTLAAMKNHDEKTIIQLIQTQEKYGAQYLDINTSICKGEEAQTMRWVIELALKHSACGLMLDSPNPSVIAEVIAQTENRPVIINSVTLTERLEELLPLIKQTGASVVGLPIGRSMPKDARDRIDNASGLINILRENGITDDRIYIDLIAEAISTGNGSAVFSVQTAREMRERYPDVHTVCGLSNISFGLPCRAHINNAFLSALILNGMDSVIMDVTNKETRKVLFAAAALSGEDEYCMNYIQFAREELMTN